MSKPTKLFVVANVTVTRATKHCLHVLLPRPGRNRLEELSVDNTRCNKM